MQRRATLMASRVPFSIFRVGKNSKLLQLVGRIRSQRWCGSEPVAAAGVPSQYNLRACRSFSSAATSSIATATATLPPFSSETKNINLHITLDWGNQDKDRDKKNEKEDQQQNNNPAQLQQPSATSTLQPSSSVKSSKGLEVLLDSVVRVLCKHAKPSDFEPWIALWNSSSSSGVIIPGKRVLTNAHSVKHHGRVKLKRGGSQKEYPAEVLAVGTECDCALLTVEDEEFWEGVTPLEFEYSPKLLESVTVVGYPDGENVPSVTSGVVKCLKTINYSRSSTMLPVIEIDAVTTHGSSGGPVFNDQGKCLGLAFQGHVFKSLSNVIPAVVVQRFIQDYEKNGAFTGFPTLGIRWQELKSDDLRKSLGMPPDRSGVFINQIEGTSPESREVLKKSDVLLSFDGVKIDNDGKVPCQHDGGRVEYEYLLFGKYIGETARVEVLRDSKIIELDLKLANHKRKILANIENESVSYYIMAGFLFTSLSKTYLKYRFGYRGKHTPLRMLERLGEMMRTPGKDIVVLSRVLTADINECYEGDKFEDLEVLSLNGMPVKNVKNLAQMVENCDDEFLEFELERGKRIVLRTRKAKSSNQEILKMHSIHSAMELYGRYKNTL